MNISNTVHFREKVTIGHYRIRIVETATNDNTFDNLWVTPDLDFKVTVFEIKYLRNGTR